jgi:hypothetical protein
MANKRLSELNELQAIEIQPDDLTLTTDVSVLESKKLRFQTLKNWILSDPNDITSSYAYNSDSASYLIWVPWRTNGTASFAISSSYALSASWADVAGISIYADTASYIDGDNVDGDVANATNALTASHLLYQGYYNGSASYALTASYVENARTSSYIWYTGVPNGTASYALNCPCSAAYSDTASYLLYNGSRPNGTASLALKAEQVDSASYLIYNLTRPNGTASFAISSSYASRSYISSQSYFLRYEGNYNGTASYALTCDWSDRAGVAGYAPISLSSSWSSQSLNSSYAVTSSHCVGTSSYAITTSYCNGTSSHSRISDTVIDTNVYRIWGPYKSTDAGGYNTTSEQYVQNFIIRPSTIAGNTIIIMALFDVKCPITTTDTDSAQVELFLEYTEPFNTWSFGPLDTTKPNNYINLVLAVSGAISGYNRTSATLAHDWPNVSGSWWRLVVRASGGALLDTTRGTSFFLYSKTDTTVVQTAYPPF